MTHAPLHFLFLEKEHGVKMGAGGEFLVSGLDSALKMEVRESVGGSYGGWGGRLGKIEVVRL